MLGFLLTGVGRLLLSLRYRVTVEGLDAVLAKGDTGILLLPNHSAYMDPPLLLTQFYGAFKPHILADRDNIDRPIVRQMAELLGVRPMADPAVYGEAALEEVDKALRTCAEDLRRGENCLLYPSGRLCYTRLEDLGGNSAVESLLRQVPDIRIVLVRTTGLWGSCFSRAVERRPDWAKGMWRGFKALLASGLFFAPKRRVRIVLHEPLDFPRQADRLTMNRYMEAFYHQDAPPALYVPYTPWEGGGERVLPEPEVAKVTGSLEEVPVSVRDAVRAKVADMAGKGNVEETALLARDLGLDSLVRMEIQLWLEQQFGHPIPDPDMLQTVGDCMLAAAGKAAGNANVALKMPDQAWFASRSPLALAPGNTLAAVFLAQVARGRGRIALADMQGGQKSYGDLLVGIVALLPRIAALPGDRIGIMLPASGAAAVVYWAVVFAGKTPVMVNWTTGARNVIQGLAMLGVEAVLSAGPLLSKVASTGTDLAEIRSKFHLLDTWATEMTWLEKGRAFVRARWGWRALAKVKVADIAAVLFTSGSESLPKAVPLTHQNLLTNVRDLLAHISLNEKDRMIGFLPPFHSFGLTGTMLLPLCAGLPVVYYANPTDSSALARLVEAYGVTMLVGTPTFLSGIVRVASDAHLASLRMAVTGAEKCPDALYEAIASRWPTLRVVEGYGITECSPVISSNTYENPQRGTIGKPLPSVGKAILDVDTGQPVAVGQPGMLLVRGPSVFGGYLHYEGPSPFVTHGGHSWYRTGDLVREAPDGTLIFAGRLKRFVKLGGEMVSLPAIEEVLLRHFTRETDKTAPLAVEASSDDQPELVLFAARAIARDEANDIIKAAGLSPLHFVRRVRRVEAIPVLGTGKTDYRALKASLNE